MFCLGWAQHLLFLWHWWFLCLGGRKVHDNLAFYLVLKRRQVLEDIVLLFLQLLLRLHYLLLVARGGRVVPHWQAAHTARVFLLNHLQVAGLDQRRVGSGQPRSVAACNTACEL
jgi:hypothetical protein